MYVYIGTNHYRNERKYLIHFYYDLHESKMVQSRNINTSLSAQILHCITDLLIN